MKRLVLLFFCFSCVSLTAQQVFVPGGQLGNSSTSRGLGINTPNIGNYNFLVKAYSGGTSALAGLESFSNNYKLYFTVSDNQNYAQIITRDGISSGKLNFQVKEMAIGGTGLGSPFAIGFRFSVIGKAIAEEVHVQPVAQWPDYVFEEEYDLISLPKLEEYILENKHLPEIPTAEEVSGETGFALGAMNAKLLKKVEELTLYVIQLHKRIEELENKNK